MRQPAPRSAANAPKDQAPTVQGAGSGAASLVTLETIDRVAILTLANPARRNALSREVLTALGDRLRAIGKDSAIKCVILRATGSVFSSGHDLREVAAANRQEAESLFALCSEVMELIPRLPQPVIAEVDGLATAAGCQLVATCDLVVAAETASFATPGVRIGLFCSTPAVALSRAVNTKKAMEMLLTGEAISAAEAERIGLVNRVVPRERLADETLRLALHVATASGETLALGKRTFYEQLPLDRRQAYAVAERAMVENAALPDAHEGIGAFLEKRAPQWRS
ncbi:MAG TPA: enoyl-CoA hydratase [Pirellulales bacterium]|nr:enoyl-CoA hydratase [Pirellulales bacterium]